MNVRCEAAIARGWFDNTASGGKVEKGYTAAFKALLDKQFISLEYRASHAELIHITDAGRAALQGEEAK